MYDGLRLAKQSSGACKEKVIVIEIIILVNEIISLSSKFVSNEISELLHSTEMLFYQKS